VSQIDIVAEISGNHNGSLSRAKELIAAAKESGATRVKIQTYTADTITINSKKPNFIISENHSLWGGKNLYQLYEEAHTPWEWHEELFSYSSQIGIPLFSTPFDVTAVNFLEELGVDMYKIASLETGDTSLLEAIAKTGKPIYASTGASTLEELDYMYAMLRNYTKSEITLLLCVSSYPAPLEESNLARLNLLKKRFNTSVGLSDHCLENDAAVLSVMLGAKVIEKHLTLSRKDGGPDSGFSLEPSEFSQLVSSVTKTHEILGNENWNLQDSERESRRFRKSIYLTQNVKKGDTANPTNIRSIRPSGGMDPSRMPEVLNRIFVSDFEAGTPLSSEMLS
jgi:pseudaminic acid synthase